MSGQQFNGAKTLFQRFRKDRSGASGMMFAIAFVPLVGGVSVALDYANTAKKHRQLRSAADAAVLQALSPNVPDTGRKAAGEEMFRVSVAQISGVSLNSSNLVVDKDPHGTWTARMTYEATVPSTFSTLFKASMVTGGTAEATFGAGSPGFRHVHILLDKSGSMGIAATPADRDKLEQVTRDANVNLPPLFPPGTPVQQTDGAPCAFACHEAKSGEHFRTYREAGDAAAVSTLTLARRHNIRIRWDIAQESLADFFTALQGPGSAGAHTELSASVFSNNVQELETRKRNAALVQSTVAAHPLNGFDSEFDVLLKWLTDKVTTSGDGSNAANVQEYILLVSDGAHHRPYATTGGLTSPEANAMNHPPTRVLMAGVDGCQVLKDRGVKIAVLHVDYADLVINPAMQTAVRYVDTWYNYEGTIRGAYIEKVLTYKPQIAINMKACASAPDLYFFAKDSLDIKTGMTQLANAINAHSARTGLRLSK